ncbi:MAG TPA: DNA-binding protein [Ktedonobacter sp.]|nr:DNA-binding protein [Ktedonobacter sp.]
MRELDILRHYLYSIFYPLMFLRWLLVTIQGNEDFMTSEETRKRLGVSPRTLERYVRDGLLKKYRRKIGREVFYKRSEVEDLLRIRPAEDTDNQ